MGRHEDQTVGDLIALIRRQQAASREEGTWAHRADDLCVVIRPGEPIRMRFVERTEPNIDPVFAKSMSLDPHYRVGDHPIGKAS